MLEDRIRKLEDLALSAADVNKEIWDLLVREMKTNNGRHFANRMVLRALVNAQGLSFMNNLDASLRAFTSVKAEHIGIQPVLKESIDASLAEWLEWLSEAIPAKGLEIGTAAANGRTVSG